MEIKNLKKRSEVKASYRPERSESTAEQELYYAILKTGLRPNRQYPIGPFFADIAFPEFQFAIEHDGKVHLGHEDKDTEREIYIRNLGWDVLRIKNMGDGFLISLNGAFQVLCQNFETAVGIAVKNIIEHIKSKIPDPRRDPNWMVKVSAGLISAEETDLIKGLKYRGGDGFKPLTSFLEKKINQIAESQ